MRLGLGLVGSSRCIFIDLFLVMESTYRVNVGKCTSSRAAL